MRCRLSLSLSTEVQRSQRSRGPNGMIFGKITILNILSNQFYAALAMFLTPKGGGGEEGRGGLPLLMPTFFGNVLVFSILNHTR